MIRKTIFWLHLGSGVAVGLVVAMMSITGVLLTYEHQIKNWADRHYAASPAIGAVPLPADDLLVSALTSGLKVNQLIYSSDALAPVLASEGRRGKKLYFEAYSGELLGPPSIAAREFFGAVTGWHRWFNAQGESRDTARLVTGVSNLAFLFLIVSGTYLWLPKAFRWSQFRVRLLLKREYTSSKGRDFHWHHIFGIWSALPLVVVVATATVFSFSWSADWVKRLAGEGDRKPSKPYSSEAPVGALLSLDELLTVAKSEVDHWNTVALIVPKTGDQQVTFELDFGSGRQPQLKQQLSLSRVSGEVVGVETFSDQPANRQARAYIRFLHTGEVYGVLGQTIAGLVSLTSLLLVWTGLALAWRRLVAPLFYR